MKICLERELARNALDHEMQTVKDSLMRSKWIAMSIGLDDEVQAILDQVQSFKACVDKPSDIADE